MSNFAVQESTLAFLRPNEGLSLKAYWDVSRYSIGYGSGKLRNGTVIKSTDMITAAEAEFLLKRDANEAAGYVNNAVTSSINRNQFDALVDLVYNAGIGTYKKSNLYGLVNSNPNNLTLIKGAFEQSPYPNFGRLERCKKRYALYSSGIVATEQGLGSNSGLIIAILLGAGFYFATKKKSRK
jgi:GH24 family phage-related lysozyme (muramidase)